MKIITRLFIFIISITVFLACRKDSFITDSNARIDLSSDTLKFDTVFTQVGSVTQAFIIKNDNNQKLKLSTVSLSGGNASSFKINIDGISAPQVNNIEIEANDSIYVFVSVTVNPTTANQPFIIQDSVLIAYNGNERYVQLEAYGQNAHFLNNAVIKGNVTWENDLPYVITGGLQVDTTARLTINKGCRVYAHNNAPILVDGSLVVNGEKDTLNRVYFQGDRLDDPYKDFPASWPGIYFRSTSKDNVLNFAVIKNAYQGLIAEAPASNANPKVLLNECIIDNITRAGIYALQSSITANNCLLSNCGNNILVRYGGNYSFNNCTVAAYSNSYVLHKEPLVSLSDTAMQNGTVFSSNLTASFVNCIFWADGNSIANEVDAVKAGSGTFNVQFTNCLWKQQTVPANVSVANMIANENPQFDSINVSRHYYNFHLKENSPAIDNGITTPLTIDLDGNSRNIGLPDMGCYERQ